jgi:mono/diheme cytochrome c family protein
MSEAGSIKMWVLAFAILCAVGFGTLVGVGCAVGANQCPFSKHTAQTSLDGQTLYQTNCIGCHGVTGQGDGPAAAFMEPKPFNFTNASVQMQHSEGQYYHFLLFGLPGTAMPAWGDYLSVQDIWDVINFLRTIPNGGLTVPDDQLNPNMVVRGGAAGPQPAPFDQNAEDYQYGQNLNVPTPTAGPPPTGSGGASQSPIANTPTPSK